MSLITQPLPEVPAASPTTHKEREAARLLGLWVSLAWQAATAAAHGTGDEVNLTRSRLQVEDALTARALLAPDELEVLIEWEASLIHHDPGVTPRACLICRKAMLDLPMHLPLPFPIGGRR